jgi:hypothetical protein
VLPFVIGPRGKLTEGTAVPATGEQHAIRMAYQMEPKVAGVVAFSRSGDWETGDYDDAVILVVLGAVPGDLLESRAA